MSSQHVLSKSRELRASAFGRHDEVAIPFSTDSMLVERARQGDTRAFSALVERHQRGVFGVALAIVHDETTAEDVAQDAFVGAWTKLSMLRDTSRFRPWVCHIAKNAALGNLRKRRATPADESDVVDGSMQSDPERALSAQRNAALLRTLLAQVSPRNREALVLYYVEGRSMAQVASALGVKPNTVEQRLSRGRRQLQQRAGAFEGVLTNKATSLALPALVFSRIGEVQAARPELAVGSTTSWTKPMLGGLMLGGLILGGVGVALVAALGSVSMPGADLGHERRAGVIERRAPAAGLEERGFSERQQAWSLQLMKRDEAQRDARPEIGYELTRLPWGGYGLSLQGGLLQVDEDDPIRFSTSWDYDEEDTPLVQGRVVDEHGRGVQATVLANRALFRWSDRIGGRVAVVSGDDGRFSLRVPVAAGTLLALRSSSAWSRPHTLPEGDAPIDDVELRLEPPGRLTGRLTYAGMPVTAAIMIVEATSGFMSTGFVGRPDGSFGEVVLPPGDYVLTAAPTGGAFDEAAPPQRQRSLVIVADRDHDVDFAIDREGTLVALSLFVPKSISDQEDPDYGVVHLMRGTHVVEDAESFDELTRAIAEMLRHADDPSPALRIAVANDATVEFDNVPPDHYTACLLLRDEDLTRACENFVVAPDSEVEQFVIDATGEHGGRPFTLRPSDVH